MPRGHAGLHQDQVLHEQRDRALGDHARRQRGADRAGGGAGLLGLLGRAVAGHRAGAHEQGGDDRGPAGGEQGHDLDPPDPGPLPGLGRGLLLLPARGRGRGGRGRLRELPAVRRLPPGHAGGRGAASHLLHVLRHRLLQRPPGHGARLALHAAALRRPHARREPLPLLLRRGRPQPDHGCEEGRHPLVGRVVGRGVWLRVSTRPSSDEEFG
mmetsp:Transcript_80976/g.262304  ORF Transcript_80976/g.262304 Transcript_80976/m.262304 type:complete len:212 (+) Transcript_80976:832-1467(+)